jgi:hypothetical protein
LLLHFLAILLLHVEPVFEDTIEHLGHTGVC